MLWMQRLVQQVYPGKWAELEALDAKYNVVEKRLGFPAKRRYRAFLGAQNTDTLVIEREWESLAVLEATFEKAFADVEWQALGNEGVSIVQSAQLELYGLLP